MGFADWFENHRFVSLCITMSFIWLLLIGFWYVKTDEITKDPCQICSASKGKDVMCTIGGIAPVSRIYYVNQSIEDILPEIRINSSYPKFNSSNLVWANNSA